MIDTHLSVDYNFKEMSYLENHIHLLQKISKLVGAHLTSNYSRGRRAIDLFN